MRNQCNCFEGGEIQTKFRGEQNNSIWQLKAASGANGRKNTFPTQEMSGENSTRMS